MKAVLWIIWQATWCLPQNLAGLILLLLLRRERHFRFHGAIVTPWDHRGCTSLGAFIFIDRHAVRDRPLLVHEYGHTVQTLILGPVWLLVIALPSVIWCGLPALVKLRREKNISYYWLYCEGWANLCGLYGTKEKFVTKECIERGRYGRPINPNYNKRKNIKGRKRNK